MDGNNNGSFWPSYVDIMTTLFAITLVLFAVSFSRFKSIEGDLKDKINEQDSIQKVLQILVNDYQNIITVYSTVGTIDSTEYFGYNEEYLKHLFSLNIEYLTKEYNIKDKLKLDNTYKAEADSIRKGIIEAGFIVKNTIEMLEQKNDSLSNIRDVL